MIAIADSGSTKTDWVILDENAQEAFRTKTIGMNPYFITSEGVENELNKNIELKEVFSTVTRVFFYGAGCAAEEMREIVRHGLSAFYINAEVNVDHDLTGAAYAVYRGKPCIVGILGTGSNSAYFDGKTLRDETPSMSYVLGDEGSGNNLGKRLIQSYFHRKLPKHLAEAFEEEYNHLTVTELNINIYKKDFANAYLASFSKFVCEHKAEPFIQKLIYSSMKEFFENQVSVYTESRFSEINFIGSVAHYYEDIIRAAAAEMRFEVGHIVRKPIDKLIEYHKSFVLGNK